MRNIRKRFLILFGVMIAISGVASATIANPCSSTAFSVTLLNADFSCEVGDKVFSNFTFSGVDTAHTTISISSLNSPTNTLYALDLHDANGFTSNFTFSYNVTVDTTVPPGSSGFRITSVNANGQVDAIAGLPTSSSWVAGYTATTGTGSGTVTATCCTVNNFTTNGPLGGFAALVLHVGDTYTITGTGNGVLDLSNTFAQGAVPEPMTLSLMGAGLLGLGLFGRKRLGRK